MYAHAYLIINCRSREMKMSQKAFHGELTGDCENTRKSENHAKIDIARQYQKSARRKCHTESTEITEKDIADAISKNPLDP